jgi:hypothetical protein
MFKRLSLLTAALLLMGALLLPSANSYAQRNPAPQVNTNATFQVIVADATLPANVDIWVDGVISAESGLNAVKPLSASGFITIPGGSHTITLFLTNTSTAVGVPFIFNFPPGPHSDWSLVLLPGSTWLSSPIADTDTHPLAGQATLRVINLSPNNNPVDVTVDAAAPSTYIGVAYQAASPTYISFPAGSHTITIPSTTVTLTKDLTSEHIYSVIVFWTGTAPKLYLSTEFSFLKPVMYLPMVVK